MTREEAIEILADKVKPCLSGTDWNDAIDMAIKALEQEPSTKNDLGVDCISRAQTQTEIEMNASRYTIAKERGGMGQVEWSDQLIKVSDAVDIIRHLPSVTPQEPRWIPVNERSPEESGMYLVSGRWKNEPYEVWICEFMYLGELKGWANDAERPIVTAWTPLPKPYEPQESEDKE